MARLIININLFIQSGDGVEEEGWYLHNAMIHEGVIYHPDCFKDLQKNGGLDTSLDTTADSVMDTSSGVIKEEAHEESDQEMKPTVPDVKLEQTEEETTAEPASEPPAAAEPSEMEVEAPVSVKEEQPESLKIEAMELTEEVKTEPSDQTADKVEEKEGLKEEKDEEKDEEKEEVTEESEKELEEESSANTSLVGDESHMMAAPVMSQPKVVNLLEGGDWLCLPSQFSSIVIITKIYLSPRPSCYERLLCSPTYGPGLSLSAALL